MTTVTLEAQPHIRPRAFLTHLPAALGGLVTSEEVLALLNADAPAPLERSESVRTAVRDMLRPWGYKPTGRGKPASEYLVRAAAAGELRPINAVVDTCNAVSLHSALPISVVDARRASQPWRIAIAAAGTSYVFNPAGQEIDVAGLPCLFDAEGPCGNAVRDAQRMKTDAATTGTLSVVWVPASCVDLGAVATAWYRRLLENAGATTRDVEVTIG